MQGEKIMKIKDKKEIGNFILNRIKEKSMTQSDLAGKIAELKGIGYEKNSIKDNVSKWIRGERYPGTEYLYYLSLVLEVSIEEMLVAGEVCDKYDDRPWTLYAIAKSGNKEALDKVMTTANECGYGSIGTNYDEYDMTLLDYILKFNNVDLLHYMIEKEYIKFHKRRINTEIRISFDGETELFNPLVELAIENDDVFIFSKTIGRTYDIAYFSFSNEAINKIFNAKKILEYLTTPFTPHDEEMRGTNLIQLSASFNFLLNFAIENNLKEKEKLLEIGKNYNKNICSELESYRDLDIEIKEDGTVISKRFLTKLATFAIIKLSKNGSEKFVILQKEELFCTNN